MRYRLFGFEIMVAITLPDGSVKEFDGATTVMQVAESIGPGLAKATAAGRADSASFC